MACWIRDVEGQPFNLSFVHRSRSERSSPKVFDRSSVVCLYEQPGLWNGGMGLWNTVFVEIPDFAFNPVKSISDLWASGHRM